MVYREYLEHIVSIGVMIVIVIATGEFPNWLWLLLPVAFGLQFLFNLSLAFVGARIGSMVTDFKNVIPFVARVWLFLSGVFYNISDVSGRAAPVAPIPDGGESRLRLRRDPPMAVDDRLRD